MHELLNSMNGAQFILLQLLVRMCRAEGRNLVTAGEEEAEVLNTFFSSVFSGKRACPQHKCPPGLALSDHLYEEGGIDDEELDYARLWEYANTAIQTTEKGWTHASQAKKIELREEMPEWKVTSPSGDLKITLRRPTTRLGLIEFDSLIRFRLFQNGLRGKLQVKARIITVERRRLNKVPCSADPVKLHRSGLEKETVQVQLLHRYVAVPNEAQEELGKELARTWRIRSVDPAWSGLLQFLLHSPPLRDKGRSTWITTLTPTPEARDAPAEPDPAPQPTSEINHPDWVRVLVKEIREMLKECISPAGEKPAPCLEEGQSNSTAVEPTDVTTVQVPAELQRQSRSAAVAPVETRKSKVKAEHPADRDRNGGTSQPTGEPEIAIITESLTYESL
ncbi:hypothetical protein RLOC_00007362 [Lonchura striata]|uniref:Uncharacterized protein n=1 Tax=Lonchura striata TaxID=40157 RepID=A0A218UDC3_9PASE|nr:hypothetical protein RLOC_00007362 [Lonchura striata domestica]